MHGSCCHCRFALTSSETKLTSNQEGGGVDLIFHTNTESGKTDDLEKDSAANMSFYNGTGEWASLSGNAEIVTDRSVVSKYYSPSLKTWVGDLGDGKHDGSENDPRIGVIRIKTKTATYAISRSNPISRGIEVRTKSNVYIRKFANCICFRWYKEQSPEMLPKLTNSASSVNLRSVPGEILTKPGTLNDQGLLKDGNSFSHRFGEGRPSQKTPSCFFRKACCL